MDTATYEQLIAWDHAHWVHPLNHPAAQERPMLVERGEGIYLYSTDGKRYIDGLAALWNVAVGHGRKELAQAAAAQMEKIAFNNNYAGFTNEPAIRLAKKLVDLCYDNMGAVFLSNSGSDTNETNFKTARFYWEVKGKPQKNKIISRGQAYHGNTLAAMSMTGMSVYWPNFEPRVAEVIVAKRDFRAECAQCRFCGDCNGCLDAVVEAIEREGPSTVAAVISEPVQGAGGVYPPEPGYFERLREICDRYEILLIADEVITGFGRTGKWFGLEHWGVRPDMVSLSKAITSGYLPLGAAVWSKEIADTIAHEDPNRKFMHAFTTSGHATAAAVALRNIQIMEDEKLVQNAADRGAQLLKGLQSLTEMPQVGHVRGLGLMAGFELLKEPESESRFDPALGLGGKLIGEMRSRGLITRYRNDNIVFAPPLMINAQQVDDMLTIIRDSLKAVTAAL